MANENVVHFFNAPVYEFPHAQCFTVRFRQYLFAANSLIALRPRHGVKYSSFTNTTTSAVSFAVR
jgi:hypothetical protein